MSVTVKEALKSFVFWSSLSALFFAVVMFFDDEREPREVGPLLALSGAFGTACAVGSAFAATQAERRS